MNVGQLLALYLLIGAACGLTVLWRAESPRLRAIPSAAAAVLVWPLWVPFALSSTADDAPASLGPLQPFPNPLAARIYAALQAAQRPQPDSLVSPADADAIRRAVAQSLHRLAAMTEQLDQRAAERLRVAGRIAQLEQRPTDAPALALARRHAQTLASLEQLRAREEQALTDLADVIELMNAQLIVAQFDETTSLTDLKAELWLRIDALEESRILSEPMASAIDTTTERIAK